MSVLSGTVTIPKVGPVKKVYAYGAGGLIAAYVGWRYWAARGTSSPAAVDTELDTGSVTDAPPGAGSASGNVQYAGSSDTTGTDGLVLTNDQWANKAAGLLVFAGWDSQVILATLGKYLARQPLSDTEATLVRAALAVTGSPPVGTFVIVHQTGDAISPSAPPVTAPPAATAPVSTGLPANATVSIPLTGSAPLIIDTKPTSSTGLVSAVPATTTTNPIMVTAKANESMAAFQGRVFATAGIGFAPTYVNLKKLNGGQAAVLEKMYNGEKHPAVSLRIK